MRVSEYIVMWWNDAACEGGTDYIQALTAKQAAEFVKGNDENIEILEVAKVCKNWR